MCDIVALLDCLRPLLPATTLRQLSKLIMALLAMTGRVTMLGISRWAGVGGSYRTVQRFFATVVPWATLFVTFFRQHLFQADHTYALAGDEVIVSKAGAHTHGLDRFYAGVLGRVIPSLGFFALALVSVQARRAYPVRIEQILRSAAEKPGARRRPRTDSGTPPRKPGRPPGRSNRTAADIVLSPELQRIQALVRSQQQLLAGWLPLRHLLLDGHFGNHFALAMARQCNLHLISKLRYDAALYLPYAGPYAGRGAHRKYGAKLAYAALPETLCCATTVDGQIQTRIYQATVWHKEFACPLNSVIIVKTHRQSHAVGHIILFSSDLELTAAQIIDYYSLRFQIEFTFRDAKQYWGLEDFMNRTPTAVTNAANLALFMVNVAHHLLTQLHRTDPHGSVLDLKAWAHGALYAHEVIKLLPEKPEPILLARIFHRLTTLGRIHDDQPVVKPP